jgi:hypothetical protein
MKIWSVGVDDNATGTNVDPGELFANAFLYWFGLRRVDSNLLLFLLTWITLYLMPGNTVN